MSQLTIDIPDDLLASLEAAALRQAKTVQQLALDQLHSIVTPPRGSPRAVHKAIREMPPVAKGEAEELMAIIKASRTSSGAVSYVDYRNSGFYVAGTRVPLDGLVISFQNGDSPETMVQNHPSLNLEQVLGALAFYLGHKAEVERSIEEGDTIAREICAQYPTPDSIR